MTKHLKNWDKTKHLFLNWLSNSQIKYIFINNFKYENLSLWWINNLTFKDSMIDNSWYKNLYNQTNNFKNRKIVKLNKFQFLSLIKKFFFTLLFTILCKLTFKKEKQKKQTTNCLLSFERNIAPYKKIHIERQYGSFQFQNKKDSRFLIFLIPNLKTILHFKKKNRNFSSMNFSFSILNSYVSIFDIFRIYLFTLFSFLKLKLFFNKDNYFFIKNVNCSQILKNLLESSFSGKIQDELIYGLALRRFLNDYKCSRFFNYCEFFNFSKSFYYFAKTSRNKIKIITINHFPYDKNNLFFSLHKKDFSHKKDFLKYSPKPDIFLTQGELYKKYLNKIFYSKKNIYAIGSLKSELNQFSVKKEKPKKIISYKKSKKKIISIFLSSNSHINIIDQLRFVDLTNFYLIIRPHPFLKDIKQKIINEFTKKLNLNVDTAENLTSKDVMKLSHFIICDDSSSAIDAILFKKKKTKIFRIISNIEPPNFSDEQGIPILGSKKEIENFLKKKKSIKQTDKKRIIKDFFFKNDFKASDRLINLIKKGKI